MALLQRNFAAVCQSPDEAWLMGGKGAQYRNDLLHVKLAQPFAVTTLPESRADDGPSTIPLG